MKELYWQAGPACCCILCWQDRDKVRVKWFNLAFADWSCSFLCWDIVWAHMALCWWKYKGGSARWAKKQGLDWGKSVICCLFCCLVSTSGFFHFIKCTQTCLQFQSSCLSVTFHFVFCFLPCFFFPFILSRPGSTSCFVLYVRGFFWLCLFSESTPPANCTLPTRCRSLHRNT